MIRVACVLVLSAVLSTGAWADDPLITKSYEIGAMIETGPEAGTGHVGLPVPIPSEEFEPWDVGEVPYISADALVEWILETVQPEIWDSNDQIAIEQIGSRLFVTAPASTHVELRAFLTHRWNDAATRIRVDVDWLGFDSDGIEWLSKQGLLGRARRGDLPPDQTKRLLAGARERGGLLASASGSFRSGKHVAIRHTTERSYVRDYAIEIAQDSTVGNPEIAVATGGWSIDLRPFVLQSGDVLLETLLLSADVEDPIRQMPLEAPPVGTVDLPSSHVRRVAGATSVAPGQACSWVFESPDELTMVLIRPIVTRLARTDPKSRGFDVSALLTDPVAFRIMVDPETAHPYAHPAVHRIEGMEAVDEGQFVDILRRRLPASSSEAEDPTIEVVGRQLFVRGQAGLAGDIEKGIGALETSLFQRRRLELRLIEQSKTAEHVLAAASLDLILGRSTCVQDGTEHAYVADWDVEVAQEARAGDPIMGALFAGWTVNARADLLPAEGVAVVAFDLTYTSVDTPFEVRRPRNEMTGVIELPRFSRVSIARQLSLEVGKAKRIDVGSRAGTSSNRLTLEVTLRDQP